MGDDGRIRQAYRFALAPTASQQAFLKACVGGSRFWFNQGLALVKERLSQRAAGEAVTVPWSYQALCSELNADARGELAPWQREVVCGCYQAGFESLGRALQSFSKARRAGQRARLPALSPQGWPTERVGDFPAPADYRGATYRPRSPNGSGAYGGTLVQADPPAREGHQCEVAAIDGDPQEWEVVHQLHGRAFPKVPAGAEATRDRRCRLGAARASHAFDGRASLEWASDAGRVAATPQNPHNYLPSGQIRPGANAWRSSVRMRRTQQRLLRLHERVANLRREQAHQLTTRLTREFGVLGSKRLQSRTCSATRGSRVKSPMWAGGRFSASWPTRLHGRGGPSL